MNRWRYTVLQILYWSSAAILFGFFVSYLQANGYSNSEIGGTVSAGNLLGLLLTLSLSARIDAQKISLFPTTLVLLICQILLFALLASVTDLHWAAAICCAAAMAFSLTVNPFYIKLSVNLNRMGDTISFGQSRAAGSLAFALTAWITGELVQRYSVTWIPWLAFMTTALQLVPVLLLRQGFDLAPTEHTVHKISTAAFLKRMPGFAVLLLGISILFAANNSINSFLITVVQHVGGDYATLGQLTLFFALLEFPAMLIYSRTARGRHTRFLRISVAAFVWKLLAITLAKSVPTLFLAFLFQSVSVGLYTPAIVDYVNDVVPYEDSAKGQSLAAMTAALGTMVATLTSGILLDHCSVTMVLTILTLTAAVGAVICYAGIHRQR